MSPSSFSVHGRLRLQCGFAQFFDVYRRTVCRQSGICLEEYQPQNVETAASKSHISSRSVGARAVRVRSIEDEARGSIV